MAEGFIWGVMSMLLQLVGMISMFLGYRGLETVLVNREGVNMVDGLQLVGDSVCDQEGGFDWGLHVGGGEHVHVVIMDEQRVSSATVGWRLCL